MLNSIHLPEILKIVAEITLIIFLGTILTRLALRGIAVTVKHLAMPQLAVRPILFIAKWVGVLVTLTAMLYVFGVDLMTLVATGLAMISIGFVAVWSLLSHITATFLLIILKTFRINDDLEFAGETVRGKVVDLNLFFTTLRGSDGALLQIPNNLFFQKVLVRRPVGQIDLESQLNELNPVDHKNG